MKHPGGFWRRHAVLWLVLAAHAALWSGIGQFISPHPDTIDHWVQSRVFSLGYNEHPPMVAWWLRGFTAVLGSSEAALEASALLVNLAVLGLAYAAANATFGRLAAALSLLFLEATLYFSAGSTVFQIDQPLMVFWLASLWSLLSYQKRRDVRWLIVMGLFAGLGGISKYTMVLFYLGLALYISVVPAARREWLNPFQYLGGLTALLAVSPLVYWNSQHDWASFRHQLSKAAPGGAGFFGLHSLEFTIGYLLLFSLPAIVWGARVLPDLLRSQGRRDGPVALILCVSLAPIGFFTLALLRGSFADPKWANVGFLGLYILLGKAAADLWLSGKAWRVRRALLIAHAVNLGLIAVVLLHIFHPFLPIAPGTDPTRQVIGWKETVREAESVLRSAGLPLPEYVVSAYYPLASEFALHLSNQPLTHSVERPWRNLWSPLDRLNESNTIAVCEGDCRRHIPRIERRTGLTLKYVGRAGAPAWGAVRHEVELYRVMGRILGWKPPPELDPRGGARSGPPGSN